MSNLRILVTGATGYVGSRLVSALVEGGNKVVAATRNPDRLAEFGWHAAVTGVSLDAGDPASVKQALADAGPIDVIYYLVHGIGQPDFRDADNRAAANVAAAARDAGVKRIVYLGGFVPTDDTLSEHLASRAEVAEALSIEGGADVVWLGAAIIIGAGSTSFEMLRYVGDRFLVIPLPEVGGQPDRPDLDPRRAALPGGRRRLRPGTCRRLRHLRCGDHDVRRTADEVRAHRRQVAGAARRSAGIDTSIVSKVTGLVLPVPGGLAADLVESLDHPMTAHGDGLRDLVPDPPGGPTSVDEAITLSVARQRPRPVNALADVHHLADTDPDWAGGDVLRITQLVRPFTLPIARPALGLLGELPGPVAAAVRTGLDTVIGLAPKVGQ